MLFTPAQETEPAPPSLGIADRGIFPDLDAQVALALPPRLSRATVRAVVDSERALLVLYADGWPVKIYPLTGRAALRVGDMTLMLRPTDRAELQPLLSAAAIASLAPGAAPAPGDADRDGIPDPLDLLLGGIKTALNRASYKEGYVRIPYPQGDVPRDMGVCTDVIIRAARNAGLDIQQALHRDIRRARRAYPMIEGNGNASIDHRRVKTLLPYFVRHWAQRSTALDDPADPMRPGDIVFMDTFPSRSGPDHIGMVSSRLGASGHPLIINNWTTGTVTAEMDLLGWVPVTHRFRFK